MTAISRPSRSRPAVSTRWLTIGLFVLPALVLYAVFVILPVLQAMQYSI
jgi:ABC-type sugar transport system permease subunit